MHIEVDSHTHTIASGHAYSTLQENIKAAVKQGIRLLASTEHGPDMPGGPHPWYFLNMRVIPRMIDGVGILRGVEANIRNIRGELDIEDDLLREMDIVLGSLHSPVIQPTTVKEHTDAVVNAITSGKIDVFAHGGNPIFPIDYGEVAKAAAEYKVLIEINNSSFTTSRAGSMENCQKLAKAVALNGGWLTFGSDAHIALNVGVFDHCSKMVGEIDFPEEQILNKSALEYIEFLNNKRAKTDLIELLELLKTND